MLLKKNNREGKMKSQTELIKIFTDIDDYELMEELFYEIFTSKELGDFTMRWQLLKELHKGKTQRSIAKQHKISLCKITRGSKILKKENSVIKTILNSLYGESQIKIKK